METKQRCLQPGRNPGSRGPHGSIYFDYKVFHFDRYRHDRHGPEPGGTGPLPPEVSDLERKVAAWRRTRHKGAATPSEFWKAAVTLAMQFRICRIGRAVGLVYSALRKQVDRAKGTIQQYVASIRRFQEMTGKSADQTSQEEIRRWVEHLQGQPIGPERLRCHYSALAFLFPRRVPAQPCIR